MTAVFVDTNVLVYLRDAANVVKQGIAQQWFESLWRAQAGRTSMQVLNEYYFRATRAASQLRTPDEAWDDVQTLLAWDPQVIDAKLLRAGRDVRQRYRISWWDSLIVGAAQLQQCPVLLTENLQDGMIFGTVTVQNPFRMKISEPRAIYTAVMTTGSRHPRRGRPARVPQS